MDKNIENDLRPTVIAGPCLAESLELLEEVAETAVLLSRELDFDLIFKASFDKANRTSGSSYRGPGMELALSWLKQIKDKYKLRVLSDVHECWQVEKVAEVCDVLQIPAFLCRQTDLLLESIRSGRAVNIKKGQFLDPHAIKHILSKVGKDIKNVAVTERGASFGYGDLVVDMRSFKIISDMGVNVIFDITHSVQQPPAAVGISQGHRQFEPLLARAATATGYLSGFFLEMHSNPKAAKSDAAVQLSLDQASTLLRQIIPMWKENKNSASIDQYF